MQPSLSSGLDLVAFAHPILINLEDRPRRLKESLRELERATGRAPVTVDDVQLVRPVRMTDPGTFNSPGFRSNFHAHLEAARWALGSGRERVVVLEDDLAFGPDWSRLAPALLDELDRRPWHLANLGYLDVYGEAPVVPDGTGLDGGSGEAGVVGWARFTGRVDGAHAYLLHRSGMDAWVDHLETLLHGRPGDHVLGPMPTDGAINTFAWADPDRIRLLAVPNLVGTRPTRSDITPTLIDRVPLVREGAELARRWRRRLDGDSRINYGTRAAGSGSGTGQ